MGSETITYQGLKVPKTYYGLTDNFKTDEFDFEFNPKNSLMITGETTNGILGDEVSSRFSVGAKVVLSRENKDYEHLRLVKDYFKIDGDSPKTIIAVGGGSIADYAKVLAKELKANLVVFTTALSHDGLVSGRSSLRNNGIKGSYEAKVPDHVVAFSEIIESSDSDLTLNGWGDHISKYSSLSEWNFALEKNQGGELFDETIYNSIRNSLDNLSESYQNLFEYFVNSGNITNSFGSSRPLSGGEHAIAHALSDTKKKKGDLTYDLDHGKRVAAFGLFLLGIYEDVGEVSEIHWKDYKKEMINLGLPTTLLELGIGYGEFKDAVYKAPTIRSRYGILDHLGERLTDQLIDYSAKRVGLV
ncbi:MAG: iron-containing alcohol dehydrogenase [Candidatus Altiarchaeota archaeon]|nr:iron-containing alcohol dehydrogenase [Candidatus Altiarchaeota archaeon]